MWYLEDKYYQEMTEEEKAEFREQSVTNKYFGSSGFTLKSGKHVSYIRDCPTCKAKRITDIVACSCGSCRTCGYRWSCYPFPDNYKKFTSFPIAVTLPKTSNTEEEFDAALLTLFRELPGEDWEMTGLSWNDIMPAFKKAVEELRYGHSRPDR